MIRLRPEQLDALREEAREALAARLVRRAAVRWPERTLGRDGTDVLEEARRLAGAARGRGLLSEEGVTAFYDLSQELGPGFEQGPSGAWARQLLRERLSPGARVRALRERILAVEAWEPYGERGRRTVTGRVTRVVGKGPPRRLEELRKRRKVLAGLAARLRTPSPGDPLPQSEAVRASFLLRVEEALRIVRNEHALRLELERTLARARVTAAAERAEAEPVRKEALRQELGGLEARYGRVRRQLLDERAELDPGPGSADAEDPCVARIETDALSVRASVLDEAARKLRLARDLCAPYGGATEGDRVVVASELSRMPGETLDLLRRRGTRVVACRGAVTDYRTDLSGARPRGWPPGFGWAEVPGFYDGMRNEVVVATRGHAPRRAGRVPAAGDGHVSASLAVHVACHAVDARCGNPSSSQEFRTARAADRDALSEYCRQPGSAGFEETWAESAALWSAEAAEMASTLPGLHRYWSERAVVRREPGGGEATALEAGEARTTRVWRRSSFGSATLDAEGGIVLDLRASDGRGILGDGRVVCPREDPRHAGILAHLRGLAPGETKPVPPWPERR